MTIEEVSTALTAGIHSIYGDFLDRVILYGSTARGTAKEDSDVDIAILLHPGASRKMYDDLLDLLVNLELEYGKVLSVIRIDTEKFAAWENVIPFYKNIKNEGIILWKAA